MTTTITTVQIVTTLIAVVSPILVGLVTKASTSSQIKALLLVTISALNGIGQGFLDNPPGTVWDWQQAVFGAVVAWVIGVATHFGLWRAENKDGVSVAKIAQRTFIKDDLDLAA